MSGSDKGEQRPELGDWRAALEQPMTPLLPPMPDLRSMRDCFMRSISSPDAGSEVERSSNIACAPLTDQDIALQDFDVPPQPPDTPEEHDSPLEYNRSADFEDPDLYGNRVQRPRDVLETMGCVSADSIGDIVSEDDEPLEGHYNDQSADSLISKASSETLPADLANALQHTGQTETTARVPYSRGTISVDDVAAPSSRFVLPFGLRDLSGKELRQLEKTQEGRASTASSFAQKFETAAHEAKSALRTVKELGSSTFRRPHQSFQKLDSGKSHPSSFGESAKKVKSSNLKAILESEEHEDTQVLALGGSLRRVKAYHNLPALEKEAQTGRDFSRQTTQSFIVKPTDFTSVRSLSHNSVRTHRLPSEAFLLESLCSSPPLQSSTLFPTQSVIMQEYSDTGSDGLYMSLSTNVDKGKGRVKDWQPNTTPGFPHNRTRHHVRSGCGMSDEAHNFDFDEVFEDTYDSRFRGTKHFQKTAPSSTQNEPIVGGSSRTTKKPVTTKNLYNLVKKCDFDNNHDVSEVLRATAIAKPGTRGGRLGLGLRPLDGATAKDQHRAGKIVVWLGVMLFPVGGFIILKHLEQDRGVAVELMRLIGGEGTPEQPHEDERWLAGFLLEVLAGFWVVLSFAALGTAVWAFIV